eukprot:CAMPEP_0174697278 /NCGR_PEP_ID=MMETSP1094-20130205/3179_1 /TAXON_ID=156173 /ORGANISM="Chrysochromulina brevifilum, Strain UTEX LB 985" /LENGTH=63 /DNA_ID=CAMNT_0015894219 /DNA_START=1244 /DNA_END=1435 /DNA_ORIENTATION=+
MHDQDASLDKSCERKPIKRLVHCLPYRLPVVGKELLHVMKEALLAHCLVDLAELVVASHKKDA